MSDDLRLDPLAAGARFAPRDGAEVLVDYGDPAAERAALRGGAGLATRPDWGVLQLEGADTRRWSNGQFTNNLRDLTPGRLVQCAMVDDKARVQGFLDGWLVAPDRLLVVLQGVTVEAFTARYERYIIFDDVEQTDLSAEFAALTLQGPEAGAVLGRAGLPVPAAEGEHAEAGGVRVGRRARSVAGGFDLLVPRAEVAALAGRLLDAGARAVGEDALEAARIEAGLARYPVDVGEKALPHELRIVDRMCSFNKGCYIGQEVVNRVDVMGQVTKKLWGLELDAVPPLRSAVMLDGQPVGVTLSAARDGDRVRALGMLRKAAWQDGLTVQVEGVGPAVVRDLPVVK